MDEQTVSTNMSFADYITSHLRVAFSWGSNDCVLFVANWLKQSTGFDYLSDIPTWKNKREAMRIVKGLGGMKQILDDRFDQVNPNMAKDGDIALYKGCMCLFSGAHIVGPFYTGLVFVKRTEAEFAWSAR